MFPAEHPPATAVPSDGNPSAAPSPTGKRSTVTPKIGVGMAKLHLPSSEDGSTRREEQDAVGVKLWVRLAQAPSQQMSALAARCDPKF